MVFDYFDPLGLLPRFKEEDDKNIIRIRIEYGERRAKEWEFPTTPPGKVIEHISRIEEWFADNVLETGAYYTTYINGNILTPERAIEVFGSDVIFSDKSRRW